MGTHGDREKEDAEMMEKRSFSSIVCAACCPAGHRGGKYNRVVQCWIGLGGSPELELIKIDSFRGGDELERCCYRCGQALVHGANYLLAAAQFPRPPQPPALTPAQGQILEKIDRGLVAPALAFAPGGVCYWSFIRKNTLGGEGLGRSGGCLVPGPLPELQGISCI